MVSQSRFASSAAKNRSTQPVSAPAVLERRRPAAELLAVVAHRPDALAGLGRVVAEVADDVVDLRERDPVAEALLGAEDRQDLALVVGRVRAPERLLGDRGGPEVGVVEDRPLVAGRDERRRQVGLPDPLGEPGAARAAAEQPPARRPSGRAGRSGRAPAGPRGPARTSRRRRSRPGRARRGRPAGRGTRAARRAARSAGDRSSGGRG